MNGQWIGKFEGTTTGTIILNIDEFTHWYQGTAFLIQDDKTIGNSQVGFSTLTKSKQFKFETQNINPINSWPGLIVSREQMKIEYPNSELPESVVVDGTWNNKSLTLNWQSNLTIGKCVLTKSQAETTSKIRPKKISWDAFKREISRLESKRFIFRGQQKPWRLRTSFHRTGRADLVRFINEDIRVLHQNLSARTKHIFNLEIPNENGAFFNLVQHHGYPTPLLDWSFSPYVAAFFAYRGITKDRVENEKNARVRILMFDQSEWQADHTQLVHLSTGRLHLSVNHFLAIENERMIPQQAISTITNIDDVETYIHYLEERNGKKYLYAFDLPLSERDKVVHELRYMGITAGSLFPGLDGACEELKSRNFDM